MSVNFDRQVGYRLHQANHVFNGLREGTAHGVHDAHGVGGRLLHDAAEEAGEVLFARAGRVVGEVDDVQAAGLGVGDHTHALLQHILPGPLELVFQLGVADGNFDDDAMAAAFDGLVDVGVHGPGEGVNLRLQAEAGDLADGFEVLVGDGGHAGLDAVDPDL